MKKQGTRNETAVPGQKLAVAQEAVAGGLADLEQDPGLTSYAELQRRLKAAEEALRAEQERSLELEASVGRFQAMLDAVDERLTLMGPDLRILWANRRARELHGEALVGKQCHAAFYGAAQPCAECPALASLTDGRPHRREMEPSSTQGEPRPSLCQAMVIQEDVAGKSRMVMAALRELSERQQLEAQLRQAQKLETIGTLAGGIAHDFNNILTAVIGFTELAMLRSEPESAAWEAMNDVRRSAHRARELVSQILAFSRRTERVQMPVLVSSLVKEALKLLRATLPTTISIEQHCAARTAKVMADPTQIHQVLMNLCTNAFHAMRESGGVLSVSLKEHCFSVQAARERDLVVPGWYLELSVSDTGCGMAPEVRQRIFEPFFTTKAAGEGTGMGLSMVQGIVKGYGGSIMVASAPGKGSRFQVFLPMLDGSQECDERFEAGPLLAGKGRVLFVDDEEAIVHLGRQILEYLGYSVEATTSSQEALDLFRARPQDFDVVLTDQTMPGMTGLDLSRQLLAIRPDLPVVLCSGYSETVTEEKLREAGVREYVLKPLSLNELSLLLSKVLGHA